MVKIGQIIICVLFFTGTHLPANPLIEQQIHFLTLTENNLDSLRILRDQRINQSAVLAAQIQQNKAREQQSYTDHRKLEKQLLKAQNLDQQIKTTEQDIIRLNRIYQDTLQNLITNLQAALDQQVAMAEKAKSESERDQYLHHIPHILAQKKLWENRVTPVQTSGMSDIQINLAPWDNTSSLHMKRDALLDQKELINREVQSIDTKITDLKKENNLRKKMAEMSGDLNLFAENEETMDRGVINGMSETKDNGYFDGMVNGPENAVGMTNQRDGTVLSYPYTIQEIVRDYQNNAINLEDRIKILSTYKEHLVSRADSLEKRAQWFDRQAAMKSETGGQLPATHEQK